MTLAPKLTLSQRQRLALTPQMRQALSVLRLSDAALSERIEAELRANPFLRRERAAGAPRERDDIDSLGARPGLYERLLRQIGLMRLSPPVREAAEYLAGSLREDGYLEASLDEIAAEAGFARHNVAAGLAALQACDPPGVGARDLAECLALQLVDLGVEADLARQAVARMPDFAARRWTRLARALNQPAERVMALADLLPRLVANPLGAELEPAPPLRADLVALRTPEGTTVDLAGESGRRLYLDPALDALAERDPAMAEARERARALIAAVARRGATLLRIARHLALVQPAPFAGDRAGLRPLTRLEVAQTLGLHPATVGRAVADKAIDIDGRLVPLTAFFTARLDGADGQPVAAAAARDRIAALIASEPPEAPLSDARLCALLRAEGVDMARRTVAKYRQALRLPPAARRRRPAAGGPVGRAGKRP